MVRMMVVIWGRDQLRHDGTTGKSVAISIEQNAEELGRTAAARLISTPRARGLSHIVVHLSYPPPRNILQGTPKSALPRMSALCMPAIPG
jgi:hypothetical protein